MDAPRWNGLELRHLVALQAVAEHGTISRAAEELGYTQSAVSQQVAGLERVVGAPVFDRPGGPPPLTLTPVGGALLEHARTILGQLRQAEADVGAVVAGEQGSLRIGTVQSVGNRVLPDVLRGFALDRPGVQVHLRESHDPGELLALVEAGDLDATFSEQPLSADRWRYQEVMVDPFVLAVPASSEEAGREWLAPEEVAELPLIGYRNNLCTSYDAVFELLGKVPTFVFQSDDNNTIQGCVGAGLGYAFVPRLTLHVDDPAIRLVEVRPAPPPRIIGMAWSARRRQPPSLPAFLHRVVETCAEIDRAMARAAAA
jgi:DNA-binding transcriptional LysR family regulator